MSTQYNHHRIDKKWQKRWEESSLYRQTIDHDKPKHYVLTMLPYPSGNLHVGHWYSMTPPDAYARFKRMNGFNVLFPMGFDAFGLPAENAAIKRNLDPKIWTESNIDHMRGQMKSMGTMFDWEREAITCDPSYYKWTQWFFTQLYKNKLAYRKHAAVDFCPSCNTTLAREQVWGDDRHCERCGTPVIKKKLDQWFFSITDYAEELRDFDDIDWPDRVKTMQNNWIGRSEGAEVIFHTEQGDEMPVFTTRPDTLWGATFMVMAPEHSLLEKIVSAEHKPQVDAYREEAARLTDIDRESADREKTGVFSGGYAINPVNGARIPIWVADYVLMGYGFGAIMAVPGHDERDFAFATQFDLPIIEVVRPLDKTDDTPLTEAYTGKGEAVAINSGWLSGTPTSEAIGKAIDWLDAEGRGKRMINYRLRDWLISRQRYWGSPIPIIHCESCGTVAVPDEDLPVMLPENIEFRPTGESPLKLLPEWYEVACPDCGKQATRETDTMDTFMCSSWYQYRYLSPNYDEGPFDPVEADYWLPVDQYTGGIEHATMHLIYTRFFTKAMRDMGLVNFDEPMLKLNNQGMILGSDSSKMSKSKGNVQDPDLLVSQFGSDTLRTFLMFFTRWEQGGPWNFDGIKGSYRFIRDVWRLGTADYSPNKIDKAADKALLRKTHLTIKKMTEDIPAFSFNTGIAAMMELRNMMLSALKKGNVSAETWSIAVKNLLLILAPIAPYITEDLWDQLGGEYSIHLQSWPQYDPEALKVDMVTLAVQVNGRVRDRITVSAEADNDTVEAAALASEKIQEFLGGKPPRKVIVIKGRLVNIVA